MPKIIAPKRTSKNVSVEDFWAIRQQFRKQKQYVTPVYRQKEVESRNRFLRLRDQVKQFNPLSYFVTKVQDYSSLQKTHTHAYLQSIAYRLPQQIMHVKRLMFGLASILKNLKQIYMMLWEHVGTEDGWRLMQCLLRDTREQSYQLWVQTGFQMVMKHVSTQYKDGLFKQIFKTLCMIMETCYSKITQNQHTLYKFFTTLSIHFFSHRNKYIRKYSIQCLSYLLTNLQQQKFKKFMVLLLSNKQQKLHQFAAAILSQRLQYSSGSLTPNSLQQLIELCTYLNQLQTQNNAVNQQNTVKGTVDNEVTSKFVSLVLGNLVQKSARQQQSQSLFDLSYVIRAFIQLANNSKISSQAVIEGIAMYLLDQSTLNKHDRKKQLSDQTLQQVSKFLWEILPSLQKNNQHIYHLLALSLRFPLENIANIKDYLTSTSDAQLIAQFLQLVHQSVSKDTVMLLIAGFSSQLLLFLTQELTNVSEQCMKIVYKLFMLSKSHAIMLNLNKLFSKQQAINLNNCIDRLIKLHEHKGQTQKQDQAKLYLYTLILLRLLTVIQLPASLKTNLSSLSQHSLGRYYIIINAYFSNTNKFKHKPQTTQVDIFDFHHYNEQVFMYSHSHSGIPLVWQASNLLQGFLLVEKNIGHHVICRNSNFHALEKVCINRLSICTQVDQMLSQSTPQSHQYLLLLLRSRHYQIRHKAIYNTLHNDRLNLSKQDKEVFQMLLTIDEDEVHLDTERNVKRMLLDITRNIQARQLTKPVCNMLISWALGFAFTGFKLIEESFANFMMELMATQQNVNLHPVIKFLEYYTFRNSRIYEQEIKKFFTSTIQNFQALDLQPDFVEMINKDFDNHELQTVQFIGVDRVTLAISKSEKVKQRLGDRLMNLINQYFSQQFVRHKKHLLQPKKQQTSSSSQLLLPPKTTFLHQMLKLCPSTYIPPLQCLHYTSTPYLTMHAVSKIKQQDWQLLWSKATKMDHTRVKFDNMSSKQMDIYLHFLWGLLLKADSNKLRIIMEYIRDYMNHKVQYFVQIFYQEILVNNKSNEQMQIIFSNMDSRKLLTCIYILKSIIKTLKNYVRAHHDKIITIVMNLVQVIQNVNNKPNNNNNNKEMLDQKQQQDNVNEQSQNQSEDQHEQNQDDKIIKKYKNHRKQIYKVLTMLASLLSNQIPIQSVDSMVAVFSQQGKISSLANVSINSTPGLLLFLRELAKNKKFYTLFEKYHVYEQIQQIVGNGAMLADKANGGAVKICLDMLSDILNTQPSQMRDQDETVYKLPSEICSNILSNIHKWMSSVNKIRIDIQTQLLSIIKVLMPQCKQVSGQCLSRILSSKTLNESSKNRLSSYIEISMLYCSVSKQGSNNNFLISMMPMIPQIRQIEHRKLIVQSISNLHLNKHTEHSLIGKDAASIVSGMNMTIDGGLVIEIDYSAFFDAVAKYKENIAKFTQVEQSFIMYNLLAYLVSTQLSVRKAVSSCLQLFLNTTQAENKDLITKLFRIASQQLKKPSNSKEQIFWSIFSCIGHFVRWVLKNDRENAGHYQIISKFVTTEGQNFDTDLFQLLCAIAQNKKLDGLRAFKSILKQCPGTLPVLNFSKYPNMLQTIFLPILQHFILPAPQPSSNSFKPQPVGNLTSSLSHVSLQLYEQVMKIAGQSTQKKQLKKMISKLKFDQMHIKKNIVIIKVIGQIVQSIDLPKVTDSVTKIVKQQGFQQLHNKMLEKKSTTSKIKEDDSDDSQSEGQVRKRIAFNGINNQIQDQELINMGYLTLDKKLIQAEQAQRNNGEQNSIIRFLRVNVLLPLKTMLMFENKSEKNSKQQSDKSRMSLSLVVTKIILKFPIDVFVHELSRILSKLCKLLKKKEVQVRDNSRKCLAQIAKLIGTDMFYLIFRELKFHLRDNFQTHVLNYTTYYILEKYGNLACGSLDSSLPLLLPPIIDELFGKSATQKQMVEQNLIPTINMQSRKRKSLDLLSIICKQISMSKISYLVKYFQKFLVQHMNSEANVNKYQQMLTNMIGGLNKNEEVMVQQNSAGFIQILHASIEQLKKQIKLYKFDDPSIKHQSSVKQNIGVGKRAGKQVLDIQDQAGRNASIFKKQAKIIQQRRNHQVLVGCFMQLHLALLALLIKRKIINSEEHSQKFESIITFIVECIEHRDNRIVHKCLKVVHNIIHWKKMQNITQIRKKASRKIFALVEKLTSADEDLLRQCFTLLNDLFEEINITLEVLHVLLTIIKLHITTVDKIIAQQPYKLLKTVLIKISNNPTLMMQPAVRELYQYVRTTMLSTTLDNIRNVGKDICCIYMKQSQQTQPPRSAHHHSSNKPNAKSSSLSTVTDYQKELSFYLNNLDTKYTQTQACILDIVKTYVVHHGRQQIQQTGEIIILALGTAFANDHQNQSKIRDVIKTVLQRIDHSKILTLLEKCFTWATNQDNQLISICGFFIIQCITSSKPTLIIAQKRATLSQICTKILQRQLQNLQLYLADMKQKAHQAKTIKSNPQWQGIIDSEDIYLKTERNFKPAMRLLLHLLMQAHSLEQQQISMLWKLLSAPSALICAQVCTILTKEDINISSCVGQKISSTNPQQMDSLKSKILSVAKNAVQIQTDNIVTCKLVFAKVFEQIKSDQNIVAICESIVLSLLNRIGKSVLNLKKNQKSMSASYSLLDSVFSIEQEISAKIIKNQKVLNEIMWNIAKVNRNQLIEQSIKQQNEHFGQAIKTIIGQAEFYRRLASTQAERKQKKNEEKAEMHRLAITDQQAYGVAKAKKKHKRTIQQN